MDNTIAQISTLRNKILQIFYCRKSDKILSAVLSWHFVNIFIFCFFGTKFALYKNNPGKNKF